MTNFFLLGDSEALARHLCEVQDQLIVDELVELARTRHLRRERVRGHHPVRLWKEEDRGHERIVMVVRTHTVTRDDSRYSRRPWRGTAS